ncbi:MAG: phosphoenolpyruvate--protein phosphotransferase [Planctomycetota bacterium]
MQTQRGIPVSPGVAVARAFVFDAGDRPIPRRQVPSAETPAQIQRLETALGAAAEEVEAIRDRTRARLGDELARIFDFHLGMLRDPALRDRVRGPVESENVTAEYAVHATFRALAESFEAHEEPFFRERASDLDDLRRRVLKHLVDQPRSTLAALDRPGIVVAHDLTPSQTAALDRRHVKALAIDAGGKTSHTAILAHALGIPAVVGLGDLAERVTTGETIIIDGDRGEAIVAPDAATLLEYRGAARRSKEQARSLLESRQLPAETRDGATIEILGNIEFPSEIDEALAMGAMGVGLYRTEYLFLASHHAPTEQEQYDAYADAIRRLDGKPLTIRTIDLGADKMPEGVPGLFRDERNPFLGCRSIRLCLQHLDLFKTQLRAVLRASTLGPVRVMFPLISNMMELRQSRMVLQDVMEDLDDAGVAFDHDLQVGMMIEVPSAALQAEAFAKEVDFFSIGTNDLIQYTVAVDRGNERIASLYSGAHPAVVRLVREVVRAADRAGVSVSLCGEMAGDREFTMLLLGLGLRSLSVTPPAIPSVKQVVRSVSLAQCQRLARRAGAVDSPREAHTLLREEVDRVVPRHSAGRTAGR